MAQGSSTLFAGMSGTVGDFVVYQAGGKTVLRTKAEARRGVRLFSVAPLREQFAGIAQMWRELSPAQKMGWGVLGQRTPDWDGTHGAAGLTGYQCFIAVNTTRQNLGEEIVTDAPLVPDLPLCLPAVSVTAGWAGGRFSLAAASAGGAFAYPVQIAAVRPLLPSAATPRVKDFVVIALLAGLPEGGADVGDAFVNRFGTPAPGAQIVVRITPLSSAGFRGQTVAASGLVAPAWPFSFPLGRDPAKQGG